MEATRYYWHFELPGLDMTCFADAKSKWIRKMNMIFHYFQSFPSFISFVIIIALKIFHSMLPLYAKLIPSLLFSFRQIGSHDNAIYRNFGQLIKFRLPLPTLLAHKRSFITILLILSTYKNYLYFHKPGRYYATKYFLTLPRLSPSFMVLIPAMHFYRYHTAATTSFEKEASLHGYSARTALLYYYIYLMFSIFRGYLPSLLWESRRWCLI